MARKRNPARLVIALSIAAVLAVFLLYTSIAGGGTPSLSPSELGTERGVVSLAGCEKRLDPQEYGQVLDSLPQVEGADKPWPLPEMQGEDKLPKGAERFLK